MSFEPTVTITLKEYDRLRRTADLAEDKVKELDEFFTDFLSFDAYRSASSYEFTVLRNKAHTLKKYQSWKIKEPIVGPNVN